MQESERQQSAESDEVGAVDAAQAFEALQAEVALQRRAIEALGEALDAHQTSKLHTDIARMLQGQAHVAQHVDLLRQHPALQWTPAQYAEALAQAGSAVVREAAQQLNQATQAVERERAQLGDLMGTVQAHGPHRRRLWWAVSAALAAGLVLSPLLMWSLPVALSSQVVAFLIGQDRWAAGWTLLQTASPENTAHIADAVHLVQANEKSLAGCKEAAAKNRRDQRCLITVATQQLSRNPNLK